MRGEKMCALVLLCQQEIKNLWKVFRRQALSVKRQIIPHIFKNPITLIQRQQVKQLVGPVLGTLICGGK